MDNKQIQDQRMRGYFMDSAKNLIKGERLRSISARHVADHAGYSYATLYNYFKDINDLIFRCVEDFAGEAAEFITGKSASAAPGRERIKATAKAYAQYFAEYPGVFELFFMEKMGNFGNRRETAEAITGLLVRLCAEDTEVWAKETGMTREKADACITQLNYTLAGLLLFYENRLSPPDYNAFMAEVEKNIESIVG